MKKETKRYMIVEYAGTKELVYETEEELKKVLDDIRKYNNRKKTKYVCGNISVEIINKKYHVNVHLYNKLTSKNTISDIDNFTKNFTKTELESYFIVKSKMKDGYEPDINIAYFETKDANDDNNRPLIYGVKYIPVLYKDDLKYFDDSFIKKCLIFHADKNDYAFFKELANEFCFYHVVGEQVERLYEYANKVEFNGYSRFILSDVAYELYKNLIYERERDGSLLRDENGRYQISARRKRDFAFFLRDYNTRKRKSPLQYNGSIIKMKKDDLIKLREQLLSRNNIKSLNLK